MESTLKLKKILVWLLNGSRGGPTRLRILKALRREPMNPNQLARVLKLNYKTVIHHLSVLERHGLVVRLESSYGAPYFLSEELERNWEIVNSLVGMVS